jgi:hypothetical protein
MDPLLSGPYSVAGPLRDRGEQMLKEIDAIGGDELLNTSPDALCDYFEERFKVDAPVLLDGDIQVDGPCEVEWNPANPHVGGMSSPATAVTYHIPFNGEA